MDATPLDQKARDRIQRIDEALDQLSSLHSRRIGIIDPGTRFPAHNLATAQMRVSEAEVVDTEQGGHRRRGGARRAMRGDQLL